MSVLAAPAIRENRTTTCWPGFWAMVGKELKQNLLPAAACLGGLSLGLLIAVAQPLPPVGAPMSGEDFISVWQNVTSACSVGGILIALALGFLQIVPEQRRDLWAFLVHRPAARSALFWSKVSAGLTLYLAATLVPLALFAVWAGMPGNLAGPTDPHLFEGGLAAIFAGWLIYFAALLTALRPARWWGSKALPVLTALLVFYCQTQSQSLAGSLLFTSIGSVVLAFSACSAFATDGEYLAQRKPARSALGLVLYIGLLIACCICAVIVVGINSILSPKQVVHSPSRQYEITTDGKLVVVSFSSEAQPTSVRTLSGLAVPNVTDFSSYFSNDIVQTASPGNLGHENLEPTFADARRYLTTVNNAQQNQEWFYSSVSHELIDYSARARLKIGELKLRGYRSDSSSGTQDYLNPVFPYALGQNLLLLNGSIYLFNSSTDTITSLGRITGKNAVGTVLSFSNRPEFVASAIPPVFLVLTNNHITTFSLSGKSIFSKALPQPIPGNEPIEIGADKQKDIFISYQEPGTAGGEVIYKYSYGGELLLALMLPPLNQSVPSSSASQVVLAALYGTFVPIAVTALYTLGLLFQRPLPNAHTLHQLYISSPPIFWHVLIGFTICACFLYGLLAYAIARRCAYTKSGLWAWTIGVFWLGLPGVLLMLALRDWPARQICPNCARKRVVSREFCEHCGAPFAPVALNGTEIFDEDGMKDRTFVSI